MSNWIKTCKGILPSAWNFAKQPNKWGYLNNPRWLTTARAFQHGGPDDYDGRESEEPQVWTPVDRSIAWSRDSQGIHHQCGHWHRPVSVAPEGMPYTVWWSCPIAIIIGDDGTPYFITSDDLSDHDPLEVSTLYSAEYDIVNDIWIERYTTTRVADLNWIEPAIGVDARGTKRVLVLFFYNLLFEQCADVFVWDGNTLLNNTQIEPSGYGALFSDLGNSSQEGKCVLIDDAGDIHVFLVLYKSGVYKLYDFKSVDDGATFTPTSIEDPTASQSYPLLAFRYGSDLFVTTPSSSATKVYKSSNNGTTWTLEATLSRYFAFDCLNNKFFGIMKSGAADVKLQMCDTLGGVWTDCLTIVGLWAKTFGGAFAYDGTYYYAAIVFRNAATPTKSDGYTKIYRSADSTTWAEVSEVVDNGEVQAEISNKTYPVFLVAKAGVLYLSFYYAELIGPQPNTYLMSAWQSSDSGASWTPMKSPFYSMVHTGAVPPV